MDLKLYFQDTELLASLFCGFCSSLLFGFLVNRYNSQIHKTSISLLINEEDVELAVV